MPLRTIVFTGTSGGGKTTALRAVEDLGFYCVDNLPLPLLTDFIELMEREGFVDRVGLVVDARLRQLDRWAVAVVSLRQRGHQVEVVYLDAADEVLLRRFSQTRRRHPLGGVDLRAGFAEERRLIEGLRAFATLSLDTSELTPHELKQLIQDRYEQIGQRLVVTLLSFGFRYGLPSHADLVFDVRFLQNPFFVEHLRGQTGLDEEVSRYVLEATSAGGFLERTEEMLRYLLPRYETEGKVYLTIGIGCTGGRHRSVALTEELARRLGGAYPINVRHRDVER